MSCWALLEICAGIGGLSSGFDYLRPIAKIEMWDVGAKILRTNKPWPSECIIEGMAQNYDHEAVKGLVYYAEGRHVNHGRRLDFIVLDDTARGELFEYLQIMKRNHSDPERKKIIKSDKSSKNKKR